MNVILVKCPQCGGVFASTKRRRWWRYIIRSRFNKILCSYCYYNIKQPREYSR